MDTQLTRRGQFLAAVTVGCVVLAAIFGARSLNAVVAPGVVALLAGVAIVHRAAPPSVERTAPPDDHPEEVHATTLEVDGCSAGNYALRDRIDAGLLAPEETYHVTEDRRTISYDVAYERRGVPGFGPISVTVTDVLDLAQRTFEVEDTRETILVYPDLVDPSAAVRSCLETVVDLERRPGRDEFERLREYVRGDSPRDVHWKSSAKQPDEDLVVKEFLGRTPTDAVRIGVAPTGDRATVDAAARAAASIAVTLLDEGVEVGLETPQETVPTGVGAAHREAILAALARLDSGSPGSNATIQITTADGEALVHAGHHTVPFRRASGGAGTSATGDAGTEDRGRRDDRDPRDDPGRREVVS